MCLRECEHMFKLEFKHSREFLRFFFFTHPYKKTKKGLHRINDLVKDRELSSRTVYLHLILLVTVVVGYLC